MISERHRFASTAVLLLLALLFVQTSLDAASLQSETLIAWQAYIQAARSRLLQRIQPGGCFLRVDETKGLAEKLRTGEPLVAPIGHTPQKLSSALIHDWVGITFVPSAKIADILSTVRDYSHYSDFYHPAVAESKLQKSDGLTDRFSMLLVNKSLLSKTAIDGDYQSSFARIDDHRWYSISETVRMQEVENYGTPDARTLTQNEGSGLIWRLFSMTSFEERDGGVYVEMEAIALSRDIPPSLRWVANPIVRHVSRNSLLTSLQQMSQAVYSRTNLAARPPSERDAANRLIVAPATGSSSFH